MAYSGKLSKRNPHCVGGRVRDPQQATTIQPRRINRHRQIFRALLRLTEPRSFERAASRKRGNETLTSKVDNISDSLRRLRLQMSDFVLPQRGAQGGRFLGVCEGFGHGAEFPAVMHPEPIGRIAYEWPLPSRHSCRA